MSMCGPAGDGQRDDDAFRAAHGFDPRTTRAQLAAEYLATIGYDPFEDDPTITEDEVARTLAEYAAEAAQVQD